MAYDEDHEDRRESGTDFWEQKTFKIKKGGKVINLTERDIKILSKRILKEQNVGKEIVDGLYDKIIQLKDMYDNNKDKASEWIKSSGIQDKMKKLLSIMSTPQKKIGGGTKPSRLDQLQNKSGRFSKHTSPSKPDPVIKETQLNNIVKRVIKEETKRGKGCAESEGGSGCIKKGKYVDKDGTEYSWHILNNKHGGVFKGCTSKKDCESILRVPGVHKG